MTAHPIKINQEPQPLVHLPLWVPSVKFQIQERQDQRWEVRNSLQHYSKIQSKLDLEYHAPFPWAKTGSDSYAILSQPGTSLIVTAGGIRIVFDHLEYVPLRVKVKEEECWICQGAL